MRMVGMGCMGGVGPRRVVLEEVAAVVVQLLVVLLQGRKGTKIRRRLWIGIRLTISTPGGIIGLNRQRMRGDSSADLRK